MRTILHSDCNGFYASVEELHHPELRGKPLAVAGDVENRHGIILAKNEIAKKYKIQTGDAIWMAKQKCPELNVVPPHFDQYMRFSKYTKAMYYEYTDYVESFGLDEAWMDVSASLQSGMDIANDISKRVKNELGITVSIGVSFNKIFAKLGSDYKKPDAITQITQDNYKEIVWPLPCSDLLFVGKSTTKKLHSVGIYTIGDIANTEIRYLKGMLGKWGEVLYYYANGHDYSTVARYTSHNDVKSIGNATTTHRDLKNINDIKTVMAVLCDSVTRRMREQSFKGKTISLQIRDNGLMSITRQGQLQNYSNITDEIYKKAIEIFKNNYDFRYKKPIRTLGISVSSLVPDTTPRQCSLFNKEENIEKFERLDKTLDNLKNRFGTFCVQPAFLMVDKTLSSFSPKEEHIIHPVGYRK